VVGALVLLLVVLVAVELHRLNTPAHVAPSFEPPPALPATGAPAIAPGNLVFDSNRTGNYEIWTMNATGGDERRLTDDRRFDSWWARLSPDRRTILFYRTPAGTHDRDYSKTSLWAMAADGTKQVELRPAGWQGWVVQGHAEWSPDGTRLVMFGGSRFHPQIWITNTLGADSRSITSGGYSVDPSWAPDGRTVVFAGCTGALCSPGSHEIYTVAANGGSPTRITYDNLGDYDPYFSHDGTQVAWLTKLSGGLLSVGAWDIRLLPVEQHGSAVVGAPGIRPRLLIPDNDGAVNSKPSWSLDDTTIYFHRAVIGLKGGFQIWAVSVHGTDLRQLTNSSQGANEYPGT
jgi:TolB protein